MSYLVGASFLSGFGVIVVVGLFNVFASRYTARYTKNLAEETDNRMKSTNEIFNNVKFIKVNAWEEYFFDKIQAKRSE
jgi:ATP-binding cassette subfamily C (CFTR/MRP) protein 2